MALLAGAVASAKTISDPGGDTHNTGGCPYMCKYAANDLVHASAHVTRAGELVFTATVAGDIRQSGESSYSRNLYVEIGLPKGRVGCVIDRGVAKGFNGNGTYGRDFATLGCFHRTRQCAVTHLKVEYPNAHTERFAFPISLIGDAKAFEWLVRIESDYYVYDSSTLYGTVSDRAPNRGGVVVRRKRGTKHGCLVPPSR